MNVRTYTDPVAFLARARAFLEIHEVANGLILGISNRLRHHPDRFSSRFLLANVEDEAELRLAAMMTPPFNLVLSYLPAPDEAAVSALAQVLHREEWRLPGIMATKENARTFARRWSDMSGLSYHVHRRQRIHRLDEVILSKSAAGELRVATDAESELVAQWAYDFHDEALGEKDRHRAERMAVERIGAGDIFLWWHGRPVSMALRTRPVAHGISIGGVYTPPEFRRQGYATACVAELSRCLLAAGYDYCSLFTDLANPTSNHIYAQIGYRPVCDINEIRFD